jgi:formylglycine-generating enzyme required for sulfatase activity
MRTQFSQLLRFAVGLGLIGLAAGPQVCAQMTAPLRIQTYAGLSITGAVGTVYAVEYLTDLAQTNDPGAWRCLEFVRIPLSPCLWADKSTPATGKRFYRARLFPAPTNMVFIPAGELRMGSPANEWGRSSDEGPQTDVILSRGIWMGKYTVRQCDYPAVMGSNPSYWQPPNYAADTNRPVERVSWFDATTYCGQLTQREQAAGRIPTNCVYRLPTEAEWEYACRAGTSDRRFSYGDDDLECTHLINYAWCTPDSGGPTHAVGLKLPNQWGLYDMHANVREWCQDWWADRLPGGIQLDPQGPATGSYRLVRGADYNDVCDECRSASRRPRPPTVADPNVGFRVVLAVGQP